MDETEKMLERLSNAHGAPGFEGPVREILKEYWSQCSVSFEIDGMGNLIGTPPQHSKKLPTILVMAHMDEIGFITKKIDDDGFITTIPLGGWVNHTLWGQKWVIQVGTRSIPAISGIDPPHASGGHTKTPSISQNQLFLDTGLCKKELEDLGIRPGLPVTPNSQFYTIGQRYVGKAMDDRAGLAVMIDLMKALSSQKKTQVVFAATVQEELRITGAKTVYATVQPDIVLNLDIGIARDYPTQFTSEKGPFLGQGPTLFFFDKSMMPNQNLVSEIAKIAKENQIPFQWEGEEAYSQDGCALQTSGQGVPTINIGIPTRYGHTPYSIIDRSDYDNTVALLTAVIENIDQHFVKIL